MYQFTRTVQKATDNGDVYRSLQNCESIARNSLHVTILAPRIWRQLLGFWKMVLTRYGSLKSVIWLPNSVGCMLLLMPRGSNCTAHLVIPYIKRKSRLEYVISETFVDYITNGHFTEYLVLKYRMFCDYTLIKTPS